MSDAVQVFCDICSRGVLVFKEPMYKCKNCGKQVCETCFSKDYKVCAECAKPIITEQLIEKRKWEEANKRIQEQQEKERRRVEEEKRRVQAEHEARRFLAEDIERKEKESYEKSIKKSSSNLGIIASIWFVCLFIGMPVIGTFTNSLIYPILFMIIVSIPICVIYINVLSVTKTIAKKYNNKNK